MKEFKNVRVFLGLASRDPAADASVRNLKYTHLRNWNGILNLQNQIHLTYAFNYRVPSKFWESAYNY